MLETPSKPASPVTVSGERIESLDVIRGIAALGILLMNSIAFGLDDAAYSNLEEGGNHTPLDTALGVVARIFIDQKMMALFSLLFGVGIVIFVERAEAKGRRPIWLSLWRNALLFGIGIIHTLVWDGDVLTAYAVCAPFVLLLRKLPASALLVIGTLCATSGAVMSLALSSTIDPAGLGEAWTTGGSVSSDSVDVLLLSDAFGRALGLMLIGVGLFRLHIVQGHRPPYVYRRMTMYGLALGVPLSAAGLVVHTSNDWASSSAIQGYGLSTLGTVPLAIAYLGLIVLWKQRRTNSAHRRLQAVGRMALTNYLTQTIFGVVVLSTLLTNVDLSRTMILGFVVAVWALQLIWSTWWLDRFRFGPFEWLWRVATYRQREPIRMQTPAPASPEAAAFDR